MDVTALLDRAAVVGVTVAALRERLIVRGPVSQEALGRELIARKQEVLQALEVPGWDAGRAEATLQEVMMLLTTAENRYTQEPACLGVLAHYAEVARNLHCRKDLLLFEVPLAVRMLLKRWGE